MKKPPSRVWPVATHTRGPTMPQALRSLILFALLASAFCEGEDATPKEKPKPSTLAPAVKYTGLHAFLHAYNPLPKVLLLLPPSEEPHPPGWFTSSAVAFKKGRDKTASFATLSGTEASKVAARLGMETLTVPKVVGITVGEGGDGTFSVHVGALDEGAGKAVRDVKAFVTQLVAGDLEGAALPAFPPPDVPRKQASVSLEELTHENLPTVCFGEAAKKPICVIALLGAGTDQCPDAVAELARRHRNDGVQFVWLRAARQVDFLAAFGVAPSDLPRLIAVRTGKRSRFALLDGALELAAMGSFVDRILGGDMSFKRVAELPELEPPYLLEQEDKDEM